jgi:hypothetical protein
MSLAYVSCLCLWHVSFAYVSGMCLFHVSLPCVSCNVHGRPQGSHTDDTEESEKKRSQDQAFVAALLSRCVCCVLCVLHPVCVACCVLRAVCCVLVSRMQHRVCPQPPTCPAFAALRSFVLSLHLHPPTPLHAIFCSCLQPHPFTRLIVAETCLWFQYPGTATVCFGPLLTRFMVILTVTPWCVTLFHCLNGVRVRLRLGLCASLRVGCVLFAYTWAVCFCLHFGCVPALVFVCGDVCTYDGGFVPSLFCAALSSFIVSRREGGLQASTLSLTHTYT